MSIIRYIWAEWGMDEYENGRHVLHSDHAAMLADLRRHNERMQQALQVLIDHGVTCLHCDNPAIDLDLQDILENV